MHITSKLKTLLATLLVGSLTWAAQAQFTNFTHIGGGATGTFITNGLGSYTFEGGGNDIWSATDEFDYAHFDSTGDFDVRVRVESVEPTARWAKAGLMARENLNGNSRMAFNRVSPADVPTGNGGNGANDTRFAFRTGTTSGGQGENEAGSGSPGYPNGWLRLQRTGDVINAFSSLDGAAWALQGSQDTTTWEGGALPATLNLGFAVARHSGAEPLATVEFRDYGTPTDTIAITTQPASQLKVVGQTATFFVRLPGGADFAVFQWFTNGAPIPGANSVSYTTPALGVADNGVIYSVGASNVNNASVALSGNATLTVLDAPELVSATTLNNPVAVYITFTRAMNGTALNPANYTVNNGVTVSAAEFTTPASNVVKITTTTLAANMTYQVSISGVQDLAGTTINPEPSTVNVSHTVGFGGITMRRYDGSGDFPTVKNKILNCDTPQRYDANLATFEYGTNPQYNSTDGDTEQYGAIVNGFYVPATTGNHIFGFAADDQAELWLSTDANPANKVLLSQQTSWNGGRQFISGDNNIPPLTGNIPLVAGQRYYMEGLFQEGGGGDHMSVAVQTPGGPAIINGTQNLIPSSSFAQLYSFGCPAIYVNNLGPVALTGPGNQSAVENSTATFTTVLDGSPPFTMQWYSNGVAIAGATTATYSFSVRLPANGQVFSVIVNNLFSSATNSSILTVIPAPQILNAGSRLDPSGTSIYVEFSKDMGASALVPGSYTVDNGVTVSAADFHQGNPRLVRLTVSSLTAGVLYAVTGTGITDPDGNLLNPNPTTRTFTHLSAPGVNAPAGLVLKRYNGANSLALVRTAINNCTAPTFTDVNQSVMSYFPNLDNYGTWMYGQFAPPTTGNYQFQVQGDDNVQLFLSTDDLPANKVLIASQTAWGSTRDYAEPNQGGTVTLPSALIPLVAGRTYYLELLHQEGGGGDHVQATVRLPGGPAIVDNAPDISRNMFATNSSFGCPPQVYFNFGPMAVTQQPVGATVNELFPVNFTTKVDGSPSYAFQWYSNNVPVPGATAANYSFTPLRYANGAQYHMIVNNGFSSATSSVVTLTVVSDEAPPAVVSVLSAPSRIVVGIIFNEPLTLLQATNPANYTITNAAGAVLAHSLSVLPEVSPDGKSVTLRTDPQTSGEQYVIVLNNLTDRAGVPNAIAPNTLAPFTASDLFYGAGAVVFRAYPTGGGNAIAELTNHPSYLNNTPDYEQVIFSMNSRTAGAPYNSNGRENYGGGIIGHFIPPSSGNWIFYISSDDDGLLLMNTNGPDSSGKSTVRFAPGCCRALTAGADATPPISLLAGQAYYIEALYKEGGGGDYVEVGARRVGDNSTITVIGSGNLAFASKLTITQNPTNLTLLEGQNASFYSSVSVAGAGAGSQRYQWQRSEDGTGASFTNIIGATSSSYTFRAFEGDSNIQFRVIVALPGLQTNTSSAAVLTVLNDEIPPVLLSARVGETGNQIILTYSEAISSAGDISNFYFQDGVPVCTVREVNGSVVTLTFDGQIAVNTPYTLFGEAQQDEFGNYTDPFITETPIFIYQPFGLQHRYSFRNPSGVAVGSNVIDSVGGAHGIVLGSPATFDGDRVFISGGASATAAYVDFPNGLLSVNGAANGGSGSGQLTLEGWARVTGNQNWSRILDIGNSTVPENVGPGGGGDGRDYLFLSAQEGGDIGRHVAVVREVDPLPDASTLNDEDSVGYGVSNFGTEFHFVITWDESTGLVRVYENGTAVGSFTSTAPFNKIHDVNVWLGRSQWSGDNNMQGDFNEFRIYNRIISPAEIAFNRTVGPNNGFDPVPLAVRLVVQTNVMLQSRTQQARVFADFLTVSNVDLTATRTFTLSTDDPTLVSVSPTSVLTAGNIAGTANLQATFNGVSSAVLPIQVLVDNFPPTLTSVRVGEDLLTLYLTYSEDIDPNIASAADNFLLTGPGDPFGVIRVVTGPVIAVTLSGALTPNATYTLSGYDQADLFGNPTAPNPTINTVVAYQPFGLTHRYSFRNAAGGAGGATVTDSVGGAHGLVQGAGATFNGDILTLPGGSSATAGYVDLPNGLLSTNAVINGGSGQVTIEGWTKVTGNQAWSRIFDFGSTSGTELPGPGGAGNGRRYLMLAAQVNVDVNTHRLEATADDGSYPNGFTQDFPALFNQVEHFVITWDDVNDRIRTYVNGVLRLDFAAGASIGDVNDVNVWLGRSTWTGDQNMQGDFDEFRMYNRILSTEEIAFNEASGPNYEFGTPLAVRLVVQTNTMLENSTQQAQVFADFASISNVNLTAYRTFSLISDNPALVSVSPTSLLTAGSGVSGIANLVAEFAGVSSLSVAITVVQDGAKPTVLSVNGTRSLDSIKVVFSEAVDLTQAQEPTNYILTDTNTNPVLFGTPVLGGDGRTVTIPVTGGHLPGAVFVLNISGIGDLAGVQNVMDATNFTFQTWIWSRGFAIADYYFGIGGGLISDLTNNPAYPNSPSLTEYVSLLESRANWNDNYGTRIAARLRAPRTGNYHFFIGSDDEGALFLSTDNDPANRVQIATEPQWSGGREFIYPSGDCCGRPGNYRTNNPPYLPVNIASNLALTAGSSYYIEALAKEGGGGDNLAVAWQFPGSPVIVNGSEPIQGTYLSSLADPIGASITVVTQPQSTNLWSGMTVTLTVSAVGTNVNGAAPVAYQWQRLVAGIWTDVVNAHSANYTITPVPPGLNEQYRALIFIPGAQTTSATATVVGLLAISWPGSPDILQEADEVTGPWIDIPAASNPFVVNPGSAPRKFYKLKPLP